MILRRSVDMCKTNTVDLPPVSGRDMQNPIHFRQGRVADLFLGNPGAGLGITQIDLSEGLSYAGRSEARSRLYLVVSQL